MDDEPLIFVDDDPPVVRRRGPKLSGRAQPVSKPRRPPGQLKPGPNFPVNSWPARTVRFRFRTRILTAAATPVNDVHANVLRLQLQARFLQSVLQMVLGYLPCAMQAWFESWFPEWTLPPRLILKQQKKNWDDEVEAEKAAYAKLRPLQGTVIPRLFGELQYDKTAALLTSDIGGVCLAAPEGGMLELDEFRRLVCQALAALSRFGALQDDTKLDNFHLTDGRVMVVDLEMTTNENRQPLTDEQLQFGVDCAVDFLAKSYEDNQYCFWEDGILSVGVD
ncbi:hypothetical protein B0T22DRAFT_172643 [Podospora appendiculata]|uniref:Protein kinase-like domain protein n=1 Tax=Podospora appendiculata TaxID=314037 RepID=A0AAE0XB83_9PEZI|nr:hypothetical protein B0T22DRAFT_172643 [Podospora appendiculata]